MLWLDRGLQSADSSINHSYTYGIYFEKKVNSWRFNGNFYKQSGINANGLKLNAHMISLEAGNQILNNVSLTVGTDILSGTRGRDLLNPNIDHDHSFVPLYSRQHRYFGIMDMFYAGNRDVVPGLQDYYLKTEIKSGTNSKLDIQLHNFYTHKELLNTENSNIESNKNLGFELDAMWTYQYSPSFKIQIGYAQFFATRSMEIFTQRGDRNEIAHFFYITFDLKPILGIL